MLGEGGKALSGGHSLIPAMKLRLNAPDTLVDVGRIAARHLRKNQAHESHI